MLEIKFDSSSMGTVSPLERKMQFDICRADKRHLNDISRLITEARIGKPLTKLKGMFWFARVEGRIVGCVGVELIDAQTAIFTYLAVEESYRKQGIGMALWEHSIEFVRANNRNTLAFITMYYHFNRFKRRGFKTIPRKFLPEQVRNHWMFTDKGYMKCAAMIRHS